MGHHLDIPDWLASEQFCLGDKLWEVSVIFALPGGRGFDWLSDSSSKTLELNIMTKFVVPKVCNIGFARIFVKYDSLPMIINWQFDTLETGKGKITVPPVGGNDGIQREMEDPV